MIYGRADCRLIASQSPTPIKSAPGARTMATAIKFQMLNGFMTSSRPENPQRTQKQVSALMINSAPAINKAYPVIETSFGMSTSSRLVVLTSSRNARHCKRSRPRLSPLSTCDGMFVANLRSMLRSNDWIANGRGAFVAVVRRAKRANVCSLGHPAPISLVIFRIVITRT